MSTKAELLLLVVDQTQIKLINPAQKIPSHTNFTWSFSNVSLRISSLSIMIQIKVGSLYVKNFVAQK